MFVHQVDKKTGDMCGTCITTTTDIMNTRKSPVLRCDLSDVKTYTKCWPMSNSICIFPDNIPKLQKRCKIENEEQWLKDISDAEKNVDFRIGYKIINSDLERAQFIFMALVEGLYCQELKLDSEQQW